MNSVLHFEAKLPEIWASYKKLFVAKMLHSLIKNSLRPWQSLWTASNKLNFLAVCQLSDQPLKPAVGTHRSSHKANKWKLRQTEGRKSWEIARGHEKDCVWMGARGSHNCRSRNHRSRNHRRHNIGRFVFVGSHFSVDNVFAYREFA